MEDPAVLLSFAELDPSTPTLDLHGMRVNEAEIQIDHFLDRLFLNRQSIGKIVHGKGSEVLANSLPKFLSRHPLIKKQQTARSMHEVGAVIYVMINL